LSNVTTIPPDAPAVGEAATAIDATTSATPVSAMSFLMKFLLIRHPSVGQDDRSEPIAA
jgi:hypothetical protein